MKRTGKCALVVFCLVLTRVLWADPWAPAVDGTPEQQNDAYLRGDDGSDTQPIGGPDGRERDIGQEMEAAFEAGTKQSQELLVREGQAGKPATDAGESPSFGEPAEP